MFPKRLLVCVWWGTVVGKLDQQNRNIVQHLPPDIYYVFGLVVCSFIHLSGQILLLQYLMNGLSNLDET